MLEVFILSLRCVSTVVLEQLSDNVSLACREVYKRRVDTDLGSDPQFADKTCTRGANVAGDEAIGSRLVD
jgi:hypothetical protein